MRVSDLYETCAPQLRRYAGRLLTDPDAAEDLVQDTFVRALGHLSTLERLPSGKRQAWLYRTLRNLHIDRRRASKREARLHESFAEYLRDELAERGHPVVWVRLPEILARVPAKDRDLLRQRYVTGMTSEQIGRQLDVPAATVRSRLHAAIKRLRARRSKLLE